MQSEACNWSGGEIPTLRQTARILMETVSIEDLIERCIAEQFGGDRAAFMASLASNTPITLRPGGSPVRVTATQADVALDSSASEAAQSHREPL